MANLANFGKSTDQQRFLVPIPKILRMASLANFEIQKINGVLGIWYNRKFGKFGKSTDQKRFLLPIQKILRIASLANFENQLFRHYLTFYHH